jgi:SAM-dependent methyltransferase
MEKKAYDDLKNIEDSWWGKGRSFAVSRVLSRFLKSHGGRVLDVGAGYGSMFPVLSIHGQVSAFEIHLKGGEACHDRGYKEVFTSILEVEKHTGEFDLLGAFDVIEHIKEDSGFSALLFRLLKSGGALIVTVPAYKFLWGSHDIENHHFRRYSKNQICTLLSEAGFEIKYASYWNFSLFPVAAILRFLGGGGGENLRPISIVNSILTFVLWLESRFIPLISFPCGTSVVVFAKRSV